MIPVTLDLVDVLRDKSGFAVVRSVAGFQWLLTPVLSQRWRGERCTLEVEAEERVGIEVVECRTRS